MRKIVSTWLWAGLLCVAFPVWPLAQPMGQIDSLLNLLEKFPQADTNRMFALAELGHIYQDVNNVRAIPFYEESGKIAKAVKHPVAEWRAYYNIGYSNLSMGQYEKATEYYLKAMKIAEANKFTGRQANTYLSLGNVFLEMGNTKSAQHYHEMAMAVYITQRDSVGLASYLNERALGFTKEKQLDSAGKYYNKALQIARAMGNGLLEADIVSNLGLHYKKQKRYAEALELFKQALVLGPKHYNTPDYLAALYNNLGAGYMANQLYDSARQAFQTSIDYSKSSSSISSEMENYRNLGQLFEMTHQPDSQLVYLQKYYLIKDSLLNADIKMAVTQKEADYRIEKKQTEIDIQKKTRNWLIGLVVLGFVAAAAVYMAWRQTRRTNLMLLNLNQRISAQKDQLEKLNGLKDRLMSIISHDLRHPLATIQTFFELSTNEEMPASQLKPLQQHTSHVVQQTSQMLDNLLVWARLQIQNEQPPLTTMDAAGLVTEVVAQIEPMASKKQVKIETHIPAQPLLVMGQDELLRIIARNLLTNAVKFSMPASTIVVSATANQGMFVLSVQDYGVGMTAEQLMSLQQQSGHSVAGTANEKGSGLGVFLVYELLKAMHGKLEIESAKEKGSVFRIVIPLAATA